MRTLTMVPSRLFRNDCPFCDKAPEIAHNKAPFGGTRRAAPTTATKKGGESDDRRIGKNRKHYLSDTEPGSSPEDPATQRNDQARSIR